MHRQALLKLLGDYQPYDKDERDMYEMLVRFVENEDQCFERGLRIGHITGSAWIVDRERSHVLLTHHRKLDRWLQLGGHADGEADVLAVALREAREESGLEAVTPLLDTPYDVDVHPIPARGDEPRHLHYHPLEAIATGMPLVYMAGGLLEPLGGPDQPGMCRSYDEAREKIARLRDGDQALGEAMITRQQAILSHFEPERCAQAWRKNFLPLVKKDRS